MHWKLHAVLSVAVASLLVLLPLANHLRPGDFVVAHDANVPATAAKALEQLEILKPQNGGLVQGIVPPISFTTAFFYGVPLALGLPHTAVQAVLMAGTFAAALWLAMMGFEGILRGAMRNGGVASRLDAALLGMLYIVAPFTLVFVSYGVFWSINIALGIGVLPLVVHFFLRCFVDERDQFRFSSLAALSLSVILVAWAILFVYPLILIAAGLLLVRGGLARLDILKILVVGVIVGLGSLLSLYGMYISVVPGWQHAFDPVASNAAWAHIRGGMLTALLQYSAWTIYTPWTPRLLLGFPSHFFSFYYVLLTVLLLGMATAFPVLSTDRSMRGRYLFAGVILLIGAFFVKGGGQPFGAAYTGMLSTVPGAGLVRTPDTKFGVFVILGIAVAIAFGLASREPRLRGYRLACRIILLVVVGYHAIPLLNGQAILGIRSELAQGDTGTGYAVRLTAAEEKIVAILRDEASQGVVVLPPTFGNTVRDGGLFSYRNVIGEFVANGLYYAAWDEMPDDAVKQRLRRAVQAGAWTALPELRVGFVLVSANAPGGKPNQYELYHAVKAASDVWERVVHEDGYELYRLRDAFRSPPLSISTPSGQRETQIALWRGWLVVTRAAALPHGGFVTFRAAHNRHWRLLAIPGGCRSHEYACLLRALIMPSAGYRAADLEPNGGVENRWRLERLPGAAETVALAVVFVPQLVVYALLVVSLVVALSCACFAWRRRPGPAKQE